MAVIIWAFAHPDDETLAAGVALAEHVAAGHDNHLLMMTRGTGSSVLGHLNGTTGPNSWWGAAHDPAAEGYEELDSAAFGAARIAECEAAIRCLATGLGDPITMHEAGLTDGSVSQSSARAAILSLADDVNPDGEVWLKAHTHLVDDNADHLAIGAAIRQLATEDPTRFANIRHYVEPQYWTDSRLSQVAESWDLPTNASISARALNACRAYQAWHPPHSFAIGYHSVSAYFGALTASVKCMYHS